MMCTNTRRRKRSKRNTRQELRRYITWLQLTFKKYFVSSHNNSITGFFLLIILTLWTTSKATMGISSPKNYRKMRLYWMHDGTQILPSQHYSLAFKTAKYSPNLEKSHSLRKISFDMHTFTSKTLDFSTHHVIPTKTIPQAPKIGVTSSSYLPKRQPKSNIIPLDQP